MSHPLLELQAAETMADQLKRRRQHLPEAEQVQAARNELIRWDQSRSRIHQRLDELEATIQRSETETQGIDTHRADLDAKLKTVIAPREAEALQSEIANLEERRGGLDDVELEAMEEQTHLEDELTVLLGQEEALRGALLDADSALSTAEADIDGELTNIAGRLEGMRADVDAGLLSRYDRLRQHFVVAAATLTGSRCEGCHLDLSAHEVDDIKDEIASAGVGNCPQCGRMLVR